MPSTGEPSGADASGRVPTDADGNREGGSRSDDLTDSELEVLGRLPGSSNATFLVRTDPGGVLAVYKPAAGERPLWDFPSGLWRREIAAYELSHAMGLDLVPLTAHRTEGPYGEGSLQLFIEARFDEHYFTILPEASEDVLAQFRRLCMFDLLANSADRKAGHCLIDQHDHIWAIDNGLSFHEELKIRTVIWDFAGEAIPQEDLAALSDLQSRGIPSSVGQWLSIAEIRALELRADWIAQGASFPHDPTGRRYPWPLV